MIANILSDSSAQCLIFGCGGISRPRRPGGREDRHLRALRPERPERRQDRRDLGLCLLARPRRRHLGGQLGQLAGHQHPEHLDLLPLRARRDADGLPVPLHPEHELLAPADVVEAAVCVPSGHEADGALRQRPTDLFAKNSEPKEDDTWWQRVRIDIRNQLLAAPTTPPQFIEEKVMLMPPKEALDTEEEKKAMLEWATALKSRWRRRRRATAPASSPTSTSSSPRRIEHRGSAECVGFRNRPRQQGQLPVLLAGVRHR